MKIICAPRTYEALQRLDVDGCIPDDLDEVVLSQAEFDEVWNTGLFEFLNF